MYLIKNIREDFLKRQPKFLHANYITLFPRHLKIHRKILKKQYHGNFLI